MSSLVWAKREVQTGTSAGQELARQLRVKIVRENAAIKPIDDNFGVFEVQLLYS